MIKGVIFDFNGTLLFDTKYHFDSWAILFKKLTNQELSDEEFTRSIKGQRNDLSLIKLNKEFNLNLTPSDITAYSEEKEALYRELVTKTNPSLEAGVSELFDFLKSNNIPFTVASSSILANINFYVSQFHLDNWIDPSTIVYDDGTYKDKVEMYKEAAKRLNIDISEALIFEDSPTGIKEASKAGCQNIVILNSDDKSLLSIPGVIDSIKDFRTAEQYFIK